MTKPLSLGRNLNAWWWAPLQCRQANEEVLFSMGETMQRDSQHLPLPPKLNSSRRGEANRKTALDGRLPSLRQFGYDEGVPGNITARDPEKEDHFWVNPFGMPTSDRFGLRLFW